MDSHSGAVFENDQYTWSHCIFILDCLAWRHSADNLWPIWCQSTIASLIKKVPKIMNIFFKWREMLIIGQRVGLICGMDLVHSWRDRWLFWIYIHGNVGHTHSTTAEIRDTVWIKGWPKEREKKNSLWTFPAVNEYHEIQYFHHWEDIKQHINLIPLYFSKSVFISLTHVTVLWFVF